jgi:acetyl-CoA carboxylase biotin carboxyl carrier protein
LRVDAARRDLLLQEIKAYMAANVLKVALATGDAVSAGDTIVVLESMKMEVPVTAEKSGTLVELRVREGDLVHEGDVIGVVASE